VSEDRSRSSGVSTVVYGDFGGGKMIFCDIFCGLATVASRGKSGQGENGGRPRRELDKRSMV